MTNKEQAFPEINDDVTNNQTLNSDVSKIDDEEYAYAEGLPNWDILPPDTLIRRNK